MWRAEGEELRVMESIRVEPHAAAVEELWVTVPPDWRSGDLVA